MHNVKEVKKIIRESSKKGEKNGGIPECFIDLLQKIPVKCRSLLIYCHLMRGHTAELNCSPFATHWRSMKIKDETEFMKYKIKNRNFYQLSDV